MRCLETFTILVVLGSILNQAFSLPQLSFGGDSNEDSDESIGTRTINENGNPTQSRAGLLADVLGTHPLGDSKNSALSNDGNCCCVSVRDACPADRSTDSSGGGGIPGGITPRLKNESSTADDPRSSVPVIAVRIVNNPVNDPQVQQEAYCEANERRCCYRSQSSLNSVIRQNRCFIRTRPVNQNVFWRQSCVETEPRSTVRGQKRCGQRRFTELSGRARGEAHPGEFPWICLVLNQNNDYIGACAIVPDNRFNDIRDGTDRVITAAHKLKKVKKEDTVKIRVIEYDASGFQQGIEKTQHKEYIVSEIITHPKYHDQRLSHDLAVLKVQTKRDRFGDIQGKIDLVATDDINAACIPGCNDMFGYQFQNRTGVRCWVAGWGKDENGNYQVVQNKVDVPIMNSRDCQRAMRGSLGSSTFQLSPSEVCAGGEENKDACDGDGGAPLVCQSNEDRWHVVGLVTWGTKTCGEKGVPGIYANIYHMRDFIMTA